MLTDQQKFLADFNLQMVPAPLGLAVTPGAEALMFDAEAADVAAYREEAAAAVRATAARLLGNPALAEALDIWPVDGARVMFAGDSITTYLYSYARIIPAMLDLHRPGHAVTFLNVAQSGYTSTHALECAYTQFSLERPDWLFVKLGVNDAKLFGAERTPLVDVATYERNIDALIRAFDGDDAPQVMLLAPTPVVQAITDAQPDFLTMRVAWDNRAVREYGTAMAKVAVARKASYLNLFDLLGPDPDPADYVADGLHPGPRGHEKIVTRILRTMGETA